MATQNGRGRRNFVKSALAIAPVIFPVAYGSTAAQAGDLTLSSARTTVVNTNNADGAGAGNVNVQAAGSVAVADPAAVIIDSSNTVVNAGGISTSAESNASGILANLSTGTPATALNLTSDINNSGTISVPGPASTSTLLNTDVFNAGIRLQGLGTFTGGITNSGTIGVGGQSSYGIAIQGPMVGDVLNSGTISLGGTSDTGIFTTGPITGNITNSGTISAPTSTSVGMYIGNRVTGTIIQSGTISVGNSATYDSAGNAITPLSGTAGIWLAGNVNQGLLFAGNGYTKAQEAANTSISTTGDSSVTVIGSGPALLVSPGGAGGYSNVVIGVRPDTPYAIVNNANIISAFNLSGAPATGINVTGATSNGTLYTSTLTGGFFNAGGDLNVSAYDGIATGFKVGAGGIVPEVKNSGDILVTTTDTTATTTSAGSKGADAYGILVDAGGTLNTFTNSGNLAVYAAGSSPTAYGVVDKSGTLTTFTNTGTILTRVNTLGTGKRIAADLSANTTGVTFSNTGNITGDVLLGSGTNSFTMSVANQNGNVSFVGGTNTLSITTSTVNGSIALGNGNSTIALNNSTLRGGLSYTTGSANLTVTNNSSIYIPDTGVLKVTNASFDSTSKLFFNLNGTNTGTGVIQSNGTVTLAAGATLTPTFTGVVRSQQNVALITANSLVLGAPAASYVPAATSYMNAYSVALDPTNANTLLLNVRRRSGAEMGLGTNTTAAYEGSIGALIKDTPLATAISSQATKDQFLAAFRQLMPDSSDATRQVALAAQNMSLGAVRRRLSGIPNALDTASGDLSSVWFQGISNVGNAKASGEQVGYDYWGLGVALGVDFPLGPNSKVGVEVTEMFNSINAGVSPNSPLLVYGTHVNVYARQELGGLYLQGMGGGGYNSYDNKRNVTIGSLYRPVVAKWKGYQAGGNLELGTDLKLGTYNLEPYVRIAYLKMHQSGYTETGGGDGVNLTLDAKDETSLKGSTGVNVGKDYALYYDSFLETDFRASYNREFKNAGSTFIARFASDGTPFINTTSLHGPNYYNVGFGIGHKDSFSSLTLDYDSEISNKFVGHTATVTLRFRL